MRRSPSPEPLEGLPLEVGVPDCVASGPGRRVAYSVAVAVLGLAACLIAAPISASVAQLQFNTGRASFWRITPVASSAVTLQNFNERPAAHPTPTPRHPPPPAPRGTAPAATLALGPAARLSPALALATAWALACAAAAWAFLQRTSSTAPTPVAVSIWSITGPVVAADSEEAPKAEAKAKGKASPPGPTSQPPTSPGGEDTPRAKKTTKRRWQPKAKPKAKANAPAKAKAKANAKGGAKAAPARMPRMSREPPQKAQPAQPLGRNQLGAEAMWWLQAGARVCAEQFRTLHAADAGAAAAYPLVAAMHRCLRLHPVPAGALEQCSQVEFHVPTMWDAFQTALGYQLQQAHGPEWQQQPVWVEGKKLSKVLVEERVEVMVSPEGPAIVSRSQLNAVLAKRLTPYSEGLTNLLLKERAAEVAACLELATAIIAADDGQRRVAEDKNATNVLVGLILRSSQTAGTESTWRLQVADGRNLQAGPFPLGQTIGLIAVPAEAAPEAPKAAAPPPLQLVEGRVAAVEEGGTLLVALERKVGADPDVLYRYTSAKWLIAVAVPDTVTHKRQLEAVRRLALVPTCAEPHAAERVVHALFPPYLPWDAAPPPPTEEDQGPRPTVAVLPAEDLDWSQSLAVAACLDAAAPVVCVQGPPGTGKTLALVEVVGWAVQRGQRVLCSAPSNAAVDNMVERLAARGLRVVRVGKPERISTAAQTQSLEALVNVDLAERRPLWGAQFKALKAKQRETQQAILQLRSDKEVAEEISKAIKKLSDEIKRAERDAELKFLQDAEVVLATTAGALEAVLDRLPAFDLVALDEAGQATEPGSWIPLLRGKRAVLFGDPLQLPPLVRDPEVREGRLDRSLLERAMLLGTTFGLRTPVGTTPIHAVFLDTQYRMNAIISEWASQALYGGQLLPAAAVRDRLLCDRPGVVSTPLTRTAMMMLDTRRPNGSLMWDCEETYAAGSLCNQGEAALAVQHVQALLAAGVSPAGLFLLSPYSAQVELMSSLLRDEVAAGLEVASVDSFQGREADAVVLSMVRSNNTRTVGFLSDARRINVAITRARCHVAVICDSATVGADPFLLQLLQYIREYGRPRVSA